MKRPLRIAIEAFSLTVDSMTGIGKATCHILERLQVLDKQNEYTIFLDDTNKHFVKKNDKWSFVHNRRNAVLEIESRVSSMYRRKKTLPRYFLKIIFAIVKKSYHLLYEIMIPFILKSRKTDLYIGFSSNFFPPFFIGSHTRKALMVYDLVWKFFPETMEIVNRIRTRLLVKRNIRRTDFMFSISDSTTRDVEELFGRKKKIYTVHLAADEKLFYPAASKEISRIRKKYGLSSKYILSVCTLEPRKNISLLLEAYSAIKNPDYSVVLVGKPGWGKSNLDNMLKKLGIEDRVIVTGYVPDEDLAALYSGAELFVFPTLYEGFGLPVLEAMQCGCPVIASNNSSIPEIAGKAALLFNEKNSVELSGLIKKVTGSRQLRLKMKADGFARADKFSWDKTAAMILKIIKNESKKIKE